MSLKRFEGRTVEDALDNAAEKLGVERFLLSYHVVVEKRGFLGGTKRVVIEAWEDDIGNRIEPPKPEVPARSEREGQRGHGDEGGPGRSSGQRERGDRGHGRSQRGRRGGRRDEPRRDEPDIEVEVGPAPPIDESESAESKTLREWFERLFELASLQLDARVEEFEETFTVRLYGDDVQRLLSKHGELLDSVQIIANKTVIVRSTNKTVELDAGEFRKKRIESLEQQARKLADQVREDAKERALPAMSPVERRIVHITLREDEDVETYSRGDGFYKRVVVTPKKGNEGSAESTDS